MIFATIVLLVILARQPGETCLTMAAQAFTLWLAVRFLGAWLHLI